MPVDTKFLVKCRDGKTRLKPVTMDRKDGKIWFVSSPFEAKDEIKSMKGSRWHGFDKPPIKMWSVEDCDRNWFQIKWLQGENPYANFDQELKKFTYPQFGSEGFGFYDPMPQQCHMADTLLTYKAQVWGAEMGAGKTLAAIMAMTFSGIQPWWWIGPKSSLYEIRLQFKDWGFDQDLVTHMSSYEKLVSIMRTWKSGDSAPMGVVFDEAHRLKTPSSQRTLAAQHLANSIRKEHGENAHILAMTGTPSPRNPGDWWALCEIVYPGFLKEGSRAAFEKRLEFSRLNSQLSGQTFNERIAWRDDEERCNVCGKYDYVRWCERNGEPTSEEWQSKKLRTMFGNHHGQTFDNEDIEHHTWEPSVNEVANIYNRLKGLVTIIMKKDCMNLPDKQYKIIRVEPSPSILRVAKAISRTAPNASQASALISELSDGFQYQEIEDGEKPCDICTDGFVETKFLPTDPGATISDTDLLDPDFVKQLVTRTSKCSKCNGTQKIKSYKRITKEVPCPKDDVVKDILEDQEDQGRVVFFARFTGTLDRMVKLCQKEGWDTIRIDGNGWDINQLKPDGTVKKIKIDNPMSYWIDSDHRRVAICAHPKSGGIGNTFCEQKNRTGARVACYVSNDREPAVRTQSEDRIHRKGMIGSATIIDIIHLPTDERALKLLKQGRNLELMSMGEIIDDYKDY